MKTAHRLRRFGLAALMIAYCPLHAEETWKEFVSKEGKFSILLPGPATEQKQQAVPTPVGPGREWQVTLEYPGSPETALGVVCTEYPVPSIDPKHTAKLLDSARDGSLKIFGGKLRSQREITLDDHSGREVIMEAEGTVVQARYYWISPRLYQVMLITTRDQEEAMSKNAEKFFGSFKTIE